MSKQSNSQNLNSVTVSSWNVSGLHSPVKRTRILSHLAKLNSEIALLQETHLTQFEASKLKQKWVGQVFHAGYDSKSRGVTILVHKKTPFVLHSSIVDPEGRYIIIDGLLYNEPIVIVNVYGPNIRSVPFFNGFNTIIPQYAGKPIIMAGDFNAVPNPALDRSSKPLPSDRATSVALTNLCKNVGLSDVWRLLNPAARNYTFYSNPHKSYSRIDAFWVSQEVLSNVWGSEIHNMIYSDHCPITLEFSPSIHHIKPSRWKLNNSLLLNENLIEFINNETQHFFDTNSESVKSFATVWEAYKATCRGWLISFATNQKRIRTKKLNEYTKKLSDLEAAHKANPKNDQLYTDMLKTKFEVRDLLNKKTEFDLYRLKSKYFEIGDKAGRLLSHRLQKARTSRIIPVIKSESGEILKTPQDINRRFKEYYKTLYSSEVNPSPDDLETFFSKINLPTLSNEDRENLERPISQAEILAAINNMASGKAPGDDGFSINFFKTFSSKLVDKLQRVFNEAKENGHLPDSSHFSLITVLPKPNKDHLQCGGYRPISLLNSERKIYAKIFARRLDDILPKLIHIDQIGFVRSRQIADNMRKLIHIMHYANSVTEPTIAVSLDAEKAFDRIEWSYLFKTLNKFGFGTNFINYISLIYSSPKAKITTNGIISEPFELRRGTPQGCPLSPMLFILSLEPLATLIRENQNIKGIAAPVSEMKISLFADDILLTLINPSISLKHTLETVKEFGAISGYKVNWDKSEALPLNVHCHKSHIANLPFKWSPDGMRYLGVILKSNIHDIAPFNLKRLINNLKDDIERWKSLPLTIWGKIDSLKMNVLPRITFLIAAIPLPLDTSFFKEVDTIFRKFIWNNKTPRISRKNLYIDREKGGLGLPNVYKYYIAFNSRYPLKWGYGFNSRDTRWESIEQEALDMVKDKVSLQGLWYSPICRNIDNPLIRFSCSIVKTFQNLIDFKVTNSPSVPLWNNYKFVLNGRPLRNDVWESKGIRTLDDMKNPQDGKLRTFTQLKAVYGIENRDFLKYMQIRSQLTRYLGEAVTIPRLTDTESKLELMVRQKDKIASKVYKWINNTSGDDWSGVQRNWETDMGISLEAEDWKRVWKTLHKVSKSVKNKMINYNFVHRTYFTPVRLHRMGVSESDLCWHCKQDKGTFYHMVWACDKVKSFWENVTQSLGKIIGYTVRCDPAMCLLNYSVEGTWSKHNRQMLTTGYMTAKRLIATNWKDADQLKEEYWLRTFLETISMEGVASALSEMYNEEQQLWTVILDTVRKIPTFPRIVRQTTGAK